MTGETPASDGTGRRTDRSSSGSTTRRTFLKATGAGVAAGGISSAAAVGSAQDSRGIPTPWLHVEGNEVRDESGNQVILRGVNVADPRRMDYTRPARGKGVTEAIDYVTDPANGIAARLVRLPVHPGDIAKATPIPHADVRVHMPDDLNLTASMIEQYCEEHLDDAVDACEEAGVYCIVDYHRHWGSGALQWDNESLSQEAELFWDTIAPRYADRSHVIYEMYNEPTQPDMGGTPLVNDWSLGIWEDWKAQAQPWLDTIRSHADNLTIIGSPVWSQYPEGGVVSPFDGEDLGYTYHIYPGHSISDTNDWDGTIEGGQDQNNGEGVYECYEDVPLFVTEFGWQPNSGYPMSGTTSGFGEPFLNWLDENPIHWTAWCFDPTWLPSAVERPFDTDDGDEDAIGDPYNNDIPSFCSDPPCEWVLRTGDHMGDTVANYLYEMRNQDVPGDGGGGGAIASPDQLEVTSLDETSATLEWTSVSSAASYAVYLDGEQVATTAETSTVLQDLSPGTSYTAAVASVTSDGSESPTKETVSFETPGDGQTPCEQAGAANGAQVDGEYVCDVNGDDLYRDVNADGAVAQDDVVYFFENQHREAWQDASLFDFSENGSVGHGDVISLFEYAVTN